VRKRVKSSFDFAVAREAEEKKVVASNPAIEQERLRKNALQIKREMEEVEKEIEAQEKFWETPAFLRKKRTV